MCTRDFDGGVTFIFQPAEEGSGVTCEMVKQGLLERFPCKSVFALHNLPDLPVGTTATRPAAIMAVADRFDIVVTAAAVMRPSPIARLTRCWRRRNSSPSCTPSLAPRVTDRERRALDTRIGGSQSHNVLPSAVELTGTVRSFDAKVQDTIEQAIRSVAAGVALGSGTSIEVEYNRYYPATINTHGEAQLALEVARQAGLEVAVAPSPAFTSEDFAFMLQQCPGAYLWLGQARKPDDVPPHHPSYDFNDDPLAGGVRLFRHGGSALAQVLSCMA
ncbi:MAG: M20/M25/M40 family metallo-hydrolase [Rhodoferax sp.]